MKLPRIATREEWLQARKQLLAQEKALTHARDALNASRRTLPMTPVEKDYAFEGPEGRVTLHALFEGRPQLIVYHFMFEPDAEAGCPGCSFFADNIGHLEHLHARGTSFVLVSRAPLATLMGYRERMGWTMPWYSSLGSEFNYDFHATTDESVAPVEYNYRSKEELEALGHSYHVTGEQPGLSVFLRDGERVYHSYSCFARGLEAPLGLYHLLDLTPFGRGEGWGGMPDLTGEGLHWTKRRGEYSENAGVPVGNKD